MRDRVLRIVSQVLDTPIELVNERSSPDTIESWDSLNHMNLVLAVEEEFGVQFSDDQIVQLLSVEALLSALVALAPPSGNVGQR